MNIKTLHYAITLAKEQNMTRAAEHLFISQPSLSQSICRLEEEVGYQLFLRQKGQIIPTPSGILFLEWAKKVLASQEKTFDRIKDINEKRITSIKIGSTIYRGNHFLSKIIPDFLKLCPQCKIILEEHSSPDLAHLLENRTIDFCITADRFDQVDYISVPCYHEELLLLAPVHMELACTAAEPYPIVSTQALNEIPFVMLARDLYIGKLAYNLFFQLNYEPDVIMQCRSLDTAFQMVLQGVAATLLPSVFLSSEQLRGIRCYQIDNPAMTREVFLIYRKEHYLTAEERVFLNLLSVTPP